MRGDDADMKRAFSLIEVLFAIAFLIMVGVAMISLNSAATRLTEASEVKQVALALNEQAIAFLALEKKTLANFSDTYGVSCIGVNGAEKTCFVNCPEDITQNCTLSADRSSIQLGANKLQFAQSVSLVETGSSGQLLVKSTSTWGTGSRNRLTTARVIE